MSYELPALAYDFNALEPHIDARTMEIHHGKHHNGYVTKLNAALEGTDLGSGAVEALIDDLSKVPEKIRTAVRNNGGGHANHSLFWQVISPKGGRRTRWGPGRGDRRRPGRIRQVQGGLQPGRRDALRERLGLAVRGSRRQAVRLLHTQSGQPPHEGRSRLPRDACSGAGCMGACVLSELSEPQTGLHQRVLERGPLGQGRGAVRGGQVRRCFPTR